MLKKQLLVSTKIRNFDTIFFACKQRFWTSEKMPPDANPTNSRRTQTVGQIVSDSSEMLKRQHWIFSYFNIYETLTIFYCGKRWVKFGKNLGRIW